MRVSGQPFPLDVDPSLPGNPDPYPLLYRLRADDPVHFSKFIDRRGQSRPGSFRSPTGSISRAPTGSIWHSVTGCTIAWAQAWRGLKHRSR